MIAPAHRLAGFGTTIFAEMSALAARTGAINLGQGFPDTDGPPEVLEAAVAAIRAGHNQYPPGPGIPELRAAVSAHQRRFYGTEPDPDGEVLITTGATEAIAAALLALCEPGDEVVTFEPYYDSYAAGIALAGAERRVVTLRPPDYAVDPDALAAAFGPRTRLILLNSPHNPTGKVFSPRRARADRRAVPGPRRARRHRRGLRAPRLRRRAAHPAAHAARHGRAHADASRRPARRSPSRAGRSAGPSARGRSSRATQTAKQFLTFVSGAPFQHAIAYALGLPDDFYEGFRAGLQAKRDRLCAGLEAAGLTVLPPGGDLLRHHRHPRRWARRTAMPSAWRCPSAPGWSRCPPSSSTTTRSPAARSSASRSASATR